MEVLSAFLNFVSRRIGELYNRPETYDSLYPGNSWILSGRHGINQIKHRYQLNSRSSLIYTPLHFHCYNRTSSNWLSYGIQNQNATQILSKIGTSSTTILFSFGIMQIQFHRKLEHPFNMLTLSLPRPTSRFYSV